MLALGRELVAPLPAIAELALVLDEAAREEPRAIVPRCGVDPGLEPVVDPEGPEPAFDVKHDVVGVVGVDGLMADDLHLPRAGVERTELHLILGALERR